MPVPLPLPFGLIHEALVVAVQEHPEAVFTLIVPESPLPGTVTLVGATV